MKQVKFLAIAIVLVVAGTLSANAQQKIGYVNIDALVYNLPESAKIQQEFQKWQEDSIGGLYTRLSEDYREKDSILKKTTAPSVKQLIEKDLAEIGATLANWQQYAGEISQRKQAQLFQPLYKKVTDAVDAHVKEKGYTYVLNSDAIYKGPDGDNISMSVAPKLGIKINAQGTAPAAGK